MHEFHPDIERQFQEQMATGQFASENDLMREALSALQFRHAELQAVEAGLASADAGRVKTLEQFEQDFRQCNGINRNL